MNLWLYCHLPRLLLDNMQRLMPLAKQHPIVLYQITSKQQQRVVQTNELAQQAGVEEQQSLVLAQSLCPNLVAMPYRQDKEVRVLQQLAEKLYGSVDKQVLYEPQGIAISINSLLRLYQGPDALIKHITHVLQAAQLSYQLSIGYSPVAARCLACANTHQLSTNSDDIDKAVKQLAVTQLGLPPTVAEKLLKSGINTVADWAAITDEQLGKRFGRQLIAQRRSLLFGTANVESYFRPAEQFFIDLDLVTEIEHWQGLLFPLKRALNELEQFLYERQKAVREITIRLVHRDKPATIVPLQLATDSWRASSFLQLLQLQIERFPLQQPVISLVIHADQLFGLNRESGELLAEGAPHQTDLADVLSRLQAKLGEQALYSPSLSDDLRPQLNESLVTPGVMLNASEGAVRRPLWLLPEPQPIDIHLWTLYDGPERLESGWWDEEPMQRDYWLAKDKQERLGWLFFQQQQWFLQGWFS